MEAGFEQGLDLSQWKAPRFPDAATMEGSFARLALLSADDHAASLFRANSLCDNIWQYLPYGPFASSASYHRWVRGITAENDPRFYAIFNKDSAAWEGVASYLRINCEMGLIEIGGINLSPALQKTPAATEAIFLMMKWAFEAGYRRLEWKCDAANMASRRAAQRFGFSFEGVFRQAAIVKGCNRDTAWFAATDQDWPALREAYLVWLSATNFSPRGKQKESLTDLTRLVRVANDPAIDK